MTAQDRRDRHSTGGDDDQRDDAPADSAHWEDPLAEYALYPIVPPVTGGIEQPHTVVTVRWPDESESHWTECPVCAATPSRTTVFEDVVIYDFDYFGRVVVPVTEHGYLMEWLRLHDNASDDTWCAALRAYRDAGGVTVNFDHHACPLED
ncbi:hypothetical protein MM440_05090 [Arsenicicoccus piscis]|uniref:Uncharacterized protein n=1 Tax=Arsenicicoccus piscis TaxID=673954 RepID=A0ABQ6HMZ1_9MICO|nr:hypothetical protein [Arsenicicoccus piscis]MCH8627175.1 hypothetical protein [Arsenicicoccus piscis]GMA18859.1 hypothetical protein GCM10025862_08800 [Arsenicicoccus piscis]